MELVESDLYDNQFYIHMDYFKNIVKYEETVKTREFLLNAAEYYKQDNDVNKACYEISKLNRYYVFRRRDEEPIKKSMKRQTKRTMKGGANIQLDDINSYLDPNKYIKKDIDSEYSLLMSVYDILTSSNIIPTSVSFDEFYGDLKYDLCTDDNMTNKQIKELCKSIIIDHELTTDNISSTTETTTKESKKKYFKWYKYNSHRKRL